FDFGLETSEGASSGLAWLDDDDGGEDGGVESDEPLAAEADFGDDWLADIGQAGRSDLPQTDWLGRVSAEADQASHRMSWLGLDDAGETQDEADSEFGEDTSYTKPDTDDLTKREMPSWLAASPEDDLGIELDSAATDTDNSALFDALDTGDNNWLSDLPRESPTSEAEGVSGLDWLSDMPSDSADDRAGDDWLNDLGDFGGPAATSQLSWFEEEVEEADVVDREKETAVDETDTTAVSPETSHLTEEEPASAELADIDPLLSFESALGAFEEDSAEGDGLDWLTVLEENEEEQAQALESAPSLAQIDEPTLSTAESDWESSGFETDDEDEELSASLADELWLAAGTAEADDEQLEIFSMLESNEHTAVDDTAEFVGDDWLLTSSETATADTAWSDDWQEEFGDGTSEYEEIPEWIDDLDGEEEEEEVQVGGPLDGLKGVIAVAPIVSQPITRINPLQTSALTITPEQTEQANLWQQVAQTELHPTRGTSQSIAGQRATPTPALPRVWRIALALLLVGAVIAGLLLPNVLGVAPAAPSPQVAAVQETLADNAGTTVLVAFEYPPAMAGELDETAVVLLRELAANGNTAVVMSQHPAGMANAERVLTAVPELDAEKVLRLGYVPGDAVGLRELSGCLSLARCQTIFGRDLSATPLTDTAVLIVLTSEQDNLINWVEQIGQPNDQPLLVAVTESLSPLARPYAQTGQISGLLQGLPDTASYAAAYQSTSTNLLTARAIPQVVVIVVLVFGLVWGLLPRRTPTSSAGAKTTSAEEEIEIL
ncbi:MAG: hypothetical protein KDD89_01545, partial [Anaerolineales bacterium]|nr:hypothetical protein [Anaerolineales bacterium]